MIIKLNDEGLVIGHISIHDDHYQGCCENNFADWGSLKDTTIIDAIRMRYESLGMELTVADVIRNIEVVEYGFKVFGHMLNCYSHQNGYYSTEIHLDVYDSIARKTEEIEGDCEEPGY